MQVFYVVTKDGRTGRRESACFGGLSNIEEVRWGDAGYITAKDIDYIIVSPLESATPEQEEDVKKAWEGLQSAVSSGVIPQYLGNVSMDMTGRDTTGNDIKYKFIVELGGRDIQETMIGAFIARNITTYYTKRRIFTALLDEGCDVGIAIILSCLFNYSVGMSSGDGSDTSFYYLGNGDSSVFSEEANTKDIVSMLKGETWNHYQGTWGDLERGYARYGYMDACESEDSEICDRTDEKLTLTDTTLKESDYKGFDFYSYFMKLSGSDRGHFTKTEMTEKIVPQFTAYIKGELEK